MKTLLTLSLCAVTLWGCKGQKNSPGETSENTLDKDVSYALGMDLGSSIKESGFYPDADEFIKGFKDSLTDQKTRFTADEARAKVEQAFMAAREKENEKLKQDEIDFLAENSKKPEVIITGSGLQYEVISQGDGAKPAETDTVRVHYKGTFADGNEFDSSYSGGEPVEFPLNGVVPGWTEGIQLMNVGSTYRFYIPSDLAYGPSGRPPVVPPYSPLIFEVELLGIKK